MRLNQVVVGQHPATSGLQLECFVSSNDGAGFPSGSGTLNIQFPRYAITGLEFNGANLIYEQVDYLVDIDILEDKILLTNYFSGDLNGDTGVSIQNIRKIDVYTGSHPTFKPDTIDFTNRVASKGVLLQSGESSIDLTIYSSEIEDKTDQTLYYKTVPKDYLTFGEESDAVSGVMFGGFEDIAKITSDTIISRSNGNDLKFFSVDLTDIFSGVTIILANDIALDFGASFRIRTNTEEIIISGSGVPLSSKIGVPVIDNSITIPTGSVNEEFDIASLVNEAGDTQVGFLVS